MEDEVLSDKVIKSLEEKRSASVRILEALDSLEKSNEWNTLKELVFNGALERIDRQLLVEAKSTQVDLDRIYTLQGERKWAVRYCNIGEFAEEHKSLLEQINRQIK